MVKLPGRSPSDTGFNSHCELLGGDIKHVITALFLVGGRLEVRGGPPTKQCGHMFLLLVHR